MLDSLSFRTKIILLIVTTFFGLAAGVALNAANLRQDLMEARKLQIRSAVEIAVQVAAAQQARAAAGELSDKEARARALVAIQDMRYGGSEGKSEYLYIQDSSGATVMHPFRPQWVGRDVSNEVRDGKGRFRTSGSYGSATVRGTKWLVQDSCAGTLVRVARGVVEARDFGRRRTVSVLEPSFWCKSAWMRKASCGDIGSGLPSMRISSW